MAGCDTRGIIKYKDGVNMNVPKASKLIVNIGPNGDTFTSVANKIEELMLSEDCNIQDMKDAIIVLAKIVGRR